MPLTQHTQQSVRPSQIAQAEKARKRAQGAASTPPLTPTRTSARTSALTPVRTLGSPLVLTRRLTPAQKPAPAQSASSPAAPTAGAMPRTPRLVLGGTQGGSVASRVAAINARSSPASVSGASASPNACVKRPRSPDDELLEQVAAVRSESHGALASLAREEREAPEEVELQETEKGQAGEECKDTAEGSRKVSAELSVASFASPSINDACSEAMQLMQSDLRLGLAGLEKSHEQDMQRLKRLHSALLGCHSKALCATRPFDSRSPLHQGQRFHHPTSCFPIRPSPLVACRPAYLRHDSFPNLRLSHIPMLLPSRPLHLYTTPASPPSQFVSSQLLNLSAEPLHRRNAYHLRKA